jgi:hypothetical protein
VINVAGWLPLSLVNLACRVFSTSPVLQSGVVDWPHQSSQQLFAVVVDDGNFKDLVVNQI